MLTIMYLMFVTVTESIQLLALFKNKGPNSKIREKQVVRDDVNKITAKFQVSSSKTVGEDRFKVPKF